MPGGTENGSDLSAYQGHFITFEGGEGAGKSTQIRQLAAALEQEGYKVLVTREPGGSPGAEAIRHVLLSGAAESFGTGMEAILFAAARNDHVEEVIRPALERGEVVLCDRFLDSSRVYQGATGDLGHDLIETLQRIAVNGVMPDLTLVFDLPAAEGLSRARARGDADAVSPDRFEKEEVETHERRREAFLEIAEGDPARCRIIDAARSVEQVSADVLDAVHMLLAGTDAAKGTQE